MLSNAREEILKKLKSVEIGRAAARPPMAALNELAWTREQLIGKFTENLVAQTGVVHRVTDRETALAKLTEVAKAEAWKVVIIATDDVLTPFDLPAWGQASGVKVKTAADFSAREAFKDAVFDEVDAGITGVDWAIAESGTVALVHDEKQPRLVSHAPILHVVIIPVDRLLPVYEEAIKQIIEAKGGIPSHMTLITGPSKTGDIQGTFFNGMHGPRRVIAFLVG